MAELHLRQPTGNVGRIPTLPGVLETRTMWKDGMTVEQVAEKGLRSYLIRCHRTVSKEYPEISNMEPEKAADFLLHLRNTGRIGIQLYMKNANSIGCRITELVPAGDSDAAPQEVE